MCEMMGKLKLKSIRDSCNPSLELTKQWRNAGAENEMGIDINGDQIDKCNALTLRW